MCLQDVSPALHTSPAAQQQQPNTVADMPAASSSADCPCDSPPACVAAASAASMPCSAGWHSSSHASGPPSSQTGCIPQGWQGQPPHFIVKYLQSKYGISLEGFASIEDAVDFLCQYRLLPEAQWMGEDWVQDESAVGYGSSSIHPRYGAWHPGEFTPQPYRRRGQQA